MKLLLIFLMSIMLTACSKQPSEVDIRLALQTEVNESNNEVKKMQNMLTIKNDDDEKKKPVKVSESDSNSDGSLETAFKDVGKAMDSVGNFVDKTVDKVVAPVFESQIYELVDVKKLGDCTQQENPAQYKCKVKTVVKNNSGTITNTADLTFIRSEGGEWITLYEN